MGNFCLRRLEQADIVCSKIYATGYKSNGKPVLKSNTQKMFNGFAIVINAMDEDLTDPTCEIMLSNGKIMRIKEERLEIVELQNEFNEI